MIENKIFLFSSFFQTRSSFVQFRTSFVIFMTVKKYLSRSFIVPYLHLSRSRKLINLLFQGRSFVKDVRFKIAPKIRSLNHFEVEHHNEKKEKNSLKFDFRNFFINFFILKPHFDFNIKRNSKIRLAKNRSGS